MPPMLVVTAGDKFSVEIARLFAGLLRRAATSSQELSEAADVEALADEFALWRADND